MLADNGAWEQRLRAPRIDGCAEYVRTDYLGSHQGKREKIWHAYCKRVDVASRIFMRISVELSN